MSLSSKPISKIIAAPDRSNLPGQNCSHSIKSNSRPIETGKQQSFRLFDNFTFSDSKPNEDHGVAGSLDYLRFQNQHLKNNWEDDVLPRFSNMTVQTEQSLRMTGPKEVPDLQPRGKFVGHFNPGYQQIVVTDKGFACHAANLPNQYINTYLPGFCVIPSQGPFVEPWTVRNIRPQIPLRPNALPPPSYLNYFDEPASSNMPYILNYVHPNFAHDEPQVPPAVQEETQDNHSIRRNIKSRSASEKQRPLKKVAFPKYPRRKNYNFNREGIEEQDIICSTIPPGPIPKGARPILSSKK